MNGDSYEIESRNGAITIVGPRDLVILTTPRTLRADETQVMQDILREAIDTGERVIVAAEFTVSVVRDVGRTED